MKNSQVPQQHTTEQIPESSLPKNDVAILDSDILQHLQLVMDDMLEPLLIDFAQRSQQQINKFQEFYQIQDFEQLRHYAHRLKGESFQIGAMRLGTVCKNLEVTAKSGDSEQSALLIQALEKEIQALQEAVERCFSDEEMRGTQT